MAARQQMITTPRGFGRDVWGQCDRGDCGHREPHLTFKALCQDAEVGVLNITDGAEPKQKIAQLDSLGEATMHCISMIGTTDDDDDDERALLGGLSGCIVAGCSCVASSSNICYDNEWLCLNLQ